MSLLCVKVTHGSTRYGCILAPKNINILILKLWDLTLPQFDTIGLISVLAASHEQVFVALCRNTICTNEHEKQKLSGASILVYPRCTLRQLRLLLFSDSGSKLIFFLVRSLCN